ncbi:MAG: peptide deformylase [Patescibacteria group bacterium]
MKDPVVQIGAKVLSERALPVGKMDIGSPKLKALIKKMKDTLTKEEFGVALAAPQIGSALRMFVIAGKAFKGEKDDEPEDAPAPEDKVFINPELVKLSRAKREMSEGCLSVRGKYGTVMRHEKASVRALDEDGKAFTYNGNGLVAHIFQHEVDHLNGILYVDKAIKLEDDSERDALREKHPA